MQPERARAFRALHDRDGLFIMPNPWDAGSAIALAELGFEALATTSAGYAATQGRPDHGIGRDEMLRHCAAIVAATDLPVSGDLGNGFGAEPETVAETIPLAAETGLAGASIEDADGELVYSLDHAVERIAAAVEAARALPFPFVLTARADGYLCGRPDLDEAIERLRAYRAAGADVLYAPGITAAADIAAIVESAGGPVTILAGYPGFDLDVAALTALGVKRISTGSALANAARDAAMRVALQMRDRGTFFAR